MFLLCYVAPSGPPFPQAGGDAGSDRGDGHADAAPASVRSVRDALAAAYSDGAVIFSGTVAPVAWSAST